MIYSVFLSHNTTDKLLIEQVEHRLWREGIRPYLYQFDSQPGESISKKIQRAIDNSDALVVLITEEGQFSKWLNAEIGYAKKAEIPIIPLVDQRINNPELPFIGDSEYIRINLDNLKDALPLLIKNLSKRKLKKYLTWGIVITGLFLIFVYDKLKNKLS